MTRPERFSTVAPLPAHGEWRRVLAVDRSGADGHAVVLSYVPHAVLDDPARLAALVRDVEAAGRLHHPSAVPVLGTKTLDDGLVVVEAYRPGTTLRALLDAGGRLPPDVAVRIAVDACGAVGRAHVLDGGDGKKLVHGAIRPERILVGDDGSSLVMGFATGAAAESADDVRALAAVLHECLAGEPPATPPASLEEAGVSSMLAIAVARGLGAAPDAPRSTADLVAALVGAGSVASHSDVAAYVDAILPSDEGARGELARALATALGGAGDAEEVSPDYIVEPTDPAVRPAEPTPEPLPRPPSTRPGADPAGVFAAPARPAKRSSAPAVAAIVCAALGFAAGFGAARLRPPAPTPASAASAAEAPRPIPTAAPQPAPAPTAAPAPPAAAELPGPAGTKAGITTRPPTRTAAPAAKAKRAAKAAKTPAKPAAGTTAKSAPDGKGTLHVTAPAEAEVFLDDRRIGKGSVHLEIPEGVHRVEVRLGLNRVAEGFSVAAGETWTYDVTPTP